MESQTETPTADVSGVQLPDWLVGVIVVIIILITAVIILIITTFVKNRRKSRSNLFSTPVGDDLESGKIAHNIDSSMMTSLTSIPNSINDSTLLARPAALSPDYDLQAHSPTSADVIYGLLGCRNPLFVDDEAEDRNNNRSEPPATSVEADRVDHASAGTEAPCTSSGYVEYDATIQIRSQKMSVKDGQARRISITRANNKQPDDLGGFAGDEFELKEINGFHTNYQLEWETNEMCSCESGKRDSQHGVLECKLRQCAAGNDGNKLGGTNIGSESRSLSSSTGSNCRLPDADNDVITRCPHAGSQLECSLGDEAGGFTSQHVHIIKGESLATTDARGCGRGGAGRDLSSSAVSSEDPHCSGAETGSDPPKEKRSGVWVHPGRPGLATAGTREDRHSPSHGCPQDTATSAGESIEATSTFAASTLTSAGTVPTQAVPTSTIGIPTLAVPTSADDVPTPDVPTNVVDIPTPAVPTSVVDMPIPAVPTSVVDIPTLAVPTSVVDVPTPAVPTSVVDIPTPAVPTSVVDITTPAVPTSVVDMHTSAVPTSTVDMPTPAVPTSVVDIPTSAVPMSAVDMPTSAVDVPTPAVPTSAVDMPTPALAESLPDAAMSIPLAMTSSLVAQSRPDVATPAPAEAVPTQPLPVPTPTWATPTYAPAKATSPSTPDTKATVASTPDTKATVASTPDTKATVASTTENKATVASTPDNKATVASTPDNKATVASTSDNKATVASTPDTKATVASTPDTYTIAQPEAAECDRCGGKDEVNHGKDSYIVSQQEPGDILTESLSPTFAVGGTSQNRQLNFVTSEDLATTGDSTSQTPTVTSDRATSQTPSVTSDGATSQTPTVTSDGATSQTPTVTSDGDTSQTPTVTSDGDTSQTPTVTSDGATSQTPTVTSDEATSQTPTVTSDGDTSQTPTVTSDGATSQTPTVTSDEATSQTPTVTGPASEADHVCRQTTDNADIFDVHL